jgi:hypothetical protein
MSMSSGAIPTAARLVSTLTPGAHDRHHHLGEASPAPLRILGGCRMITGVEEYVSLLVPDEHARDGGSIISVFSAGG